VLSAALMLDFLGEHDAADRIRAACQQAAQQAGSGSTTDIGSQIAAVVAG
jgi:3-isopropylmalate dehydrogenase